MVTKAGKKVSTVTIDSAQEQHSGEYTCVAENKAGITRQSAYLHVYGTNSYQHFTDCMNYFSLIFRSS